MNTCPALHAVIASVLLLAGSAFAEDRTADVRDFAVIQREGVARVLFRLHGVERDANVIVSSAKLTLPIAGEAEDRTLRLRVYPVTRDWDAGTVRWDGAWTRSGGDFDEDAYVPVLGDLRKSSAAVDLTPLVKHVVESGADTYGFLLTLDPGYGEGVSLSDVSRLSGLAMRTAEITYRRVGPRPPAERIRRD